MAAEITGRAQKQDVADGIAFSVFERVHRIFREQFVDLIIVITIPADNGRRPFAVLYGSGRGSLHRFS